MQDHLYNPTLGFFYSEEGDSSGHWWIIRTVKWIYFLFKVTTFNVACKCVWISLFQLELNLGNYFTFVILTSHNKSHAQIHCLEAMTKCFLQLSLVVSNDSHMIKFGSYTEACTNEPHKVLLSLIQTAAFWSKLSYIVGRWQLLHILT